MNNSQNEPKTSQRDPTTSQNEPTPSPNTLFRLCDKQLDELKNRGVGGKNLCEVCKIYSDRMGKLCISFIDNPAHFLNSY